MKKKFLSVLLTLVMVVTVLPNKGLIVKAAEVKANIGGLDYILNDETSKANIEGVSGELPEKLTIPATVNWNDKTFEVEGINERAFEGNQNIRKVEISNGIIEIGEGAFFNSSLEGITFPNSVNKIGAQTFFMCEKLEEVNLPNNAEYDVISSALFLLCTSLKDITIPNNVTSIESAAFSRTSLKDVKVPDSVEKIENDAFSHCESLETISLSKNPNYNCIRENTFSTCTSLKNIEIPNNIKEIENGVFSYSGLISITIPNSVTRIGHEAFSNCENLETVILPVNSEYNCIESFMFWCCKSLKNVEIPKNVSRMEENAFANTNARIEELINKWFKDMNLTEKN